MKNLQKLFPNLDESVRMEDIDRAIYQIESFLERQPYTTDRELYEKLLKRLNKLRGHNGKS